MNLLEHLNNDTYRTVTLGAAIVGLTSGAVGSFAVLRKQSLLGDALSHAALPGIAFAFLFFGKQPVWILIGAAISGWLAMVVVSLVTRNSRIPFDSALGGSLAVFFGFGLVMMTSLKRLGNAADVKEVNQYLFGQSALLRENDLWIIAIVGSFIVLMLALSWKQFKLVSFDPEYAASLGYRVRLLDFAITGLLVVTIVIGLKSVGVVLMSSLVVAPAVAARQWTHRLGRMVILAAGFGLLSSVLGSILSIALSGNRRPVPPGPTIVLCAVAWVIVSLLWRKLTARHSLPVPAGISS